MHARIIYDPVTKYSKSYGFVEFTSSEEAQRAITEVSGMVLAGRMIKVSNAHYKEGVQVQGVGAPGQGGFSGADILPVEN